MLKRLVRPFQTYKQHLVQLSAIIETDLRKLKHDPYELFTRMIQPIIWLVIFGQAMSKVQPLQIGSLSYLDYIAPGILAQSVLFISIFFGISLIWERDMGILHKILVAPVPRSLLVIGRAICAGIRGILQIFIVYLLCFVLKVHLRVDFIAFLGVMTTVMLIGAIFSTFSLIVASIVKKRERFMGIGQVLAMPLFFASNALYPINNMPKWLQTLSFLNPLTYQVESLRNFMITGNILASDLLINFSVGLMTFIILVIIATRIYPKILY